MGRRWDGWVASALLLGLVLGCTPGGGAAGGPEAGSPRSPSPSAPASSRPAPSSQNSDGTRDTLPIPDVRPEGFREPPPGRGADRYRDQELTWRPCEQGTECAEIAVPLDHADPDGQAITIALRRARTSGDARGTIFVNPGGPGGSGWSMVGGFAGGLFGYDVVGWDPRGVGRSTPVQCANGPALDAYYDLDATPDDAAEERAWETGNRELAMSCLAKSGRLLEHVSTVETVTDLDLLRHLVGDDKLHYLGFSYGTQIGAVYAQLFGANVGHLVLDSAVNITDDDTVVQAEGFDRALTNFAAWCVAEFCDLGEDQAEVISTITTLWDQLDRAPLPVGDRHLTQSLAVLGTVVPLYDDEEGWPELEWALLDALDGDGAGLLDLADAYNERRDDGTYGQLLFAFDAIRCLDEADGGLAGARRDEQDAARKAPIFGGNSGADLICPLWPVAPRDPVGVIDGADVAVPILVIGTTGDSATPYEYAESMARQLRTGVLLTYEGEGHGAFGRGQVCIDQAVRDYFVDDRPPPPGKRCAADRHG